MVEQSPRWPALSRFPAALRTGGAGWEGPWSGTRPALRVTSGFLRWAELPQRPLLRGPLASSVVTLRGEWSGTSFGVPQARGRCLQGYWPRCSGAQRLTVYILPMQLPPRTVGSLVLCFLCPSVGAQGRGGGSFSLTRSLSWLPE